MASPGGATQISCPASITATRLHSWRMTSAACDTTTIVRPSSLNWLIRSMHFCWNLSSPTARTSSTRRMSGLTFTATAKPSLTYIPDE